MAVGTGGKWSSIEMFSRGLLDCLAIGLPIPIPSGRGEGLSIEGSNASSAASIVLI
jgi:hypothetical protein